MHVLITLKNSGKFYFRFLPNIERLLKFGSAFRNLFRSMLTLNLTRLIELRKLLFICNIFTKPIANCWKWENKTISAELLLSIYHEIGWLEVAVGDRSLAWKHGIHLLILFFVHVRFDAFINILILFFA